MVRTIIPDKTTAVTAAQAITAALFARERSGRGQHVKLAMLDVMVAYLWAEGMTGFTFVGGEVKASRAQIAQDLVFETQRRVHHRGRGVGRGVARDVPRARAPRVARRSALRDTDRPDRERGGAARAHRRGAARTQERGVAGAARPRGRAVRADPQPRAGAHPPADRRERDPRGERAPVRPGGSANRVQPRSFAETPARMRRHAPRLGEHSREVLREAGLDDDEIGELVATASSGLSASPARRRCAAPTPSCRRRRRACRRGSASRARAAARGRRDSAGWPAGR